MNQNSANIGMHPLGISCKTRSFAHPHVPKSANIGSENRLTPIRRRATTQLACHTTTCGQLAPKRTVPKFQNQLIAACLIITSIFALRAESAPADILLKGGTIIDGTGGKPYEGSVAIRDGHITAVGSDADAANAKKTIDCKGLIICPGFIDLHNHSDSTILRDSGRSARCYLTQGCTTLVTGNCGGGPTDIAKFYDDLDAKGTGINIATLVTQGSVREKVMGNDLRAPKPDELKKMQDLVDSGMQQGAWGISTG